MSNEAVSGQFAAVDGVGALINWTVTRSRPSVTARHSGTRGGRARRKGVGSWQGTMSGIGGLPPSLPGKLANFIGYSGPANSIEGGAGHRYSGTIIITDVTIKWDFSTNAIIAWDLSFVGHLGLTRGDGAAVVDATSTIEWESSLLPIKFDVVLAGDYAAFTDMTTVQLKITSDVVSFVNSSTANETGRRTSTLVDWELSIGLQRSDAPLAEGTELAIQAFTTDELFWELKYGRVREYSGITANRETGEIMSQTLVIEMSSNLEADGAIGVIKAPGDVQYWPTP
jgi:hypothetical protein